MTHKDRRMARKLTKSRSVLQEGSPELQMTDLLEEANKQDSGSPSKSGASSKFGSQTKVFSFAKRSPAGGLEGLTENSGSKLGRGRKKSAAPAGLERKSAGLARRRTMAGESRKKSSSIA